MQWKWLYLDRDGAEVSAGSARFPNQADAETWIGETWQELLEQGVETVTLLEGERIVYGPMGLRPV